MTNLPPMPYRAFRDEFLREDGSMRAGVYEAPPPEDHDPYERRDYEEEEE